MAKETKSPARILDLPVQSTVLKKKSKAAYKLKQKADLGSYEKALEKLNPPYEVTEEKTLMPKGFSLIDPQLTLAPFPYGWILAATTRNPTHDAIKSFTAQWLVPEPPIDDGQLLFVFIGITNATDLVQCQLQWGNTSCGGGGGYWSIGCTHTRKGKAFCERPNIPVKPGAAINATISLYKAAGQKFYYHLSIDDSNNTVEMTCNYLISPRDCSIVLETYGLETEENFPPNRYTTIDNIRIETVANQPMPVSWKNRSQQNPSGQHLAIPTNNRIALWYHSLPVNPAMLS